MSQLIRITVLICVLTAKTYSTPIDNGLLLERRLVPGKSLETEVCVPGISDIIFVIDGSTSIGEANFEFLRLFLAAVVEELPDGTHFACVQFSGTPKVEFTFNTYGDDKAATQRHFRQLNYKRGTTKVALALDYALERVFPESAGNRPDVGDIVIVITDGRSTDDPGVAARKIRQMGAKTFAIGITAFVDDEQLLSIGGSNASTFKIDQFERLDLAFRKVLIGQASCTVQTEAPSLGEPSLDISCGENSIGMASNTKNPFEGQVYVKNHFADPDCVVKGDGDKKNAAITVPFDKCGTIRRRSQNPKGVYVENTVVFKFHPKFLTKIDRVFKVQCFYMEAEKTVERALEVSMLTTVLVTMQFEMPTCQYTLHSGSPTGPTVRFALVGQPVFHKWQCDNSQSERTFKMRVHSCFVTDGTNDTVRLLDIDGCANDKHLLNNLEYDEGGMMASIETHVFKYADRAQLFFQCQIELCVDLAQGCPNTPPQCTELSRRKRLASSSSYTGHTIDVITDQLSIADLADVDHDLLRSPAAYAPIQQRRSRHLAVCLTHLELYLFLALTLGTFMLISTIMAAQQLRAPSDRLIGPLW